MSKPESKPISAEAEEYYQQGLSYDYDAKQERPDLIRPELRSRKSDRDNAMRNYRLAVELGHPDAMNNLANELARGPYAYPEEVAEAFSLYRSLAEMEDYRGYFGMGGMLLRGFKGQKSDESLATPCIEKAAILAPASDIAPSIALASLDLNTQLALAQAPFKPDPRLERGLVLMENGIFHRNELALDMMILYYTHRKMNGLKAEYFSRYGAGAGLLKFPSSLEGNYRVGNFGDPNPEMSKCFDNLAKENLTELETLCPRPDGPLTREMAGLPPAPTAPLDIPKFLQDFKVKHPDL